MPRTTIESTPRDDRPSSRLRVTAVGLSLGFLATLLACYEATTPAEPPPPRGLEAPQLQLSDTATADGASLLPLTVVIDTATPAEKRTIALSATAGAFAASNSQSTTVLPDATGAARSLLRAPGDSAAVIVTATVNGVSVSRTVTYRRAMPDFVDVVPGQLDLLAGPTHELSLTAFLRRTVGKPSPSLRVTFAAVEPGPGGKAIGAFLPATAVSDANGVATTKFTIADTTKRGRVVIRASIVPAGVIGETTIDVTGPALVPPKAPLPDSAKASGA